MNTENPLCQRMQYVRGACNELCDVVDVLHTSIEKLVPLLWSVLRTVPKNSDQPSDAGVRILMCPLADAMYDKIDVLRNAQATVNDIIDRLEL